jgi:cephalosporin-C deacetylase-like acetyl esterase
MPAHADEKLPYPDSIPDTDLRAAHVPYTLDTHRPFPEYKTLAEWKKRKQWIRDHVLVSCGLYPLPEKTPLQAKIFDRVERDGYSIEKVYFQTYPGFYLAGNLYRPLVKGKRHPGILVAHGHWANGRMADQVEGSISARAITFARQGYVAFTYDMVGYNDTKQVDHRFANTPTHWLWGVSNMGLQTWNSIRALDFLVSLPDVDKKRLAITGESGGGTQTMMLGAIEDRLTATAPCVMVSHTMQGGCVCENAPNLRQDFFNVELAATVAPKPQIIVGASGDWTTTTMTMEGPSLAKIYQLYGKPEQERHVLFNYGHNINKDSREAVYAFFGNKLLGISDEAKLKEPSYKMEPVAALRVFPDSTPMPADAKNAKQMTEWLIAQGKARREHLFPKDSASLARFQKTYRTVWEHTLCVEIPKPSNIKSDAESAKATPGGATIIDNLVIGRKRGGDRIPLTLVSENNADKKQEVHLIVRSGGRQSLTTAEIAEATQKGYALALLDPFLMGEQADKKLLAQRRRPFLEFFSTYNRTNMQERVQDVLTTIAFLRTLPNIGRVVLHGQGEGGLIAMLAAPVADEVIADVARLDLLSDTVLLEEENYVPGLRQMGDVETALLLSAPKPITLYNVGERFPALSRLKEVYSALGIAERLTIR